MGHAHPIFRAHITSPRGFDLGHVKRCGRCGSLIKLNSGIEPR